MEYENFILKLESKTAAVLKAAAEFYNLSPEDYIRDAVCELLIADSVVMHPEGF